MTATHRKNAHPTRRLGNHPMDNDDGSVIILVLMVLVIMTVIAIVSSNTVVTDNFIVRNAGIHRQNVNLVESALLRGLQDFMQIDNNSPINLFDENRLPNDWINPDTGLFNNAPGNPGWYELNFTGRVLNPNNSVAFNMPNLITQRGENLNDNLRYALVGWSVPAGGSVSGGKGQAQMQEGRCLAEYVSLNAGNNDNGFGLLRMELGLRRKWVIN